MNRYICTSKNDIVVIEGKEYTTEHLIKTLNNYEGVLKRVNKYKKKVRAESKTEVQKNKKVPTAANS